jgi:drug/metabolite transporter (DMT)-like permease
MILLLWLGAGLRGRRALLWCGHRQLLVLGVPGMYVCGAWICVAGHSTPSANIALIYAATQVTIAAASAWLLNERLWPEHWAALALALVWVLFVITQRQLTRLLAMRFVPGDAWLNACSLAWPACSMLLNRWPSALSAGERLLAIIGGGLVVLMPAAVVKAAFTPVPSPSWAALGLVLAAAVLPGVLPYSAHSYLQREIGASRTAMMLYLSPVYGALLAWWMVGEQPGWHQLSEALPILPSIWLATRTA